MPTQWRALVSLFPLVPSVVRLKGRLKHVLFGLSDHILSQQIGMGIDALRIQPPKAGVETPGIGDSILTRFLSSWLFRV